MKKDRKLFPAATAAQSALERLVALYQDETERMIEGALAERLPNTLTEVGGELAEIKAFLGEALEAIEALAESVEEAQARADALDLGDTYRSIFSQMQRGEW